MSEVGLDSLEWINVGKDEFGFKLTYYILVDLVAPFDFNSSHPGSSYSWSLFC
jgi:hypothetical protein